MPSSPDQLKKAYQAFKKRLKLTRLDNESRLGHGPMRSGEQDKILAIQPPGGFPPEIWDELVAEGKLRRSGHGLYELAIGRPRD